MNGNTGPVFNAEGGSGGGAPPAAPPPNGGEGGTPGVTAPWAGAQGVWKVGEGEAAKPWWSTISEPEARQHLEAKQYANPAELALANYNLTKMQRGADDVLALPAKDAPPEAWNDVWKKLGRPDTPDAYDLKFGEGVKTDDGMVKFGKELFHEMGLDPTRAQKAADKWNTFVAAQEAAAIEQARTANTQELDALSSKWGADLEKNKAAGQRAVHALGLSNEFIERLENQIGSAPVVELLAMIGRKSDEGGFVNTGGQADPNNPATMTREQAAARISQLQGDAEFQKKYTDKNHPNHKEALQLMERLFARA